MAKVEHRKARKDYPTNGIKKGDMYYFAQIKTGPRSSRIIRQIAPIKPQQLTSSPFKSGLLDWEDAKSALTNRDDAQALADTIRELGEEQQASFDNMPEGLQQGDTGQMLEARATACEEAASEIEEIISRWEDAETEHEGLVAAHEESQSAFDDWESAATAAEEAGEEYNEPEPVIEDDPGEFDEDEFISEIQAVEVNE